MTTTPVLAVAVRSEAPSSSDMAVEAPSMAAVSAAEFSEAPSVEVPLEEAVPEEGFRSEE